MSVKQTNPEIAFDVVYLAQKRGESWTAGGIDRLTRPRLIHPQIHAVISRVLADQIDLANAFGDQGTDLRDNRLGRAASMFAAHLRNHAKAAGMIATFGYFQIGRMGRRQPESRRVVIRNVGWSRALEA